jgi:hypothetical protein
MELVLAFLAVVFVLAAFSGLLGACCSEHRGEDD